MEYNILLLPGDGIGQEIINEARKVLEAVARRFGHSFNFEEALIGGSAIDVYGEPFPTITRDKCLSVSAVLLGAVGGPKWDDIPGEIRPEKGLLAMRAAMKVYANLRPVFLFPELADASPIKREIIGDKLNILIVRELTGGIYFGKRGRIGDSAFDTETYCTEEIERVSRIAFNIAKGRNKKLTLVDKANVLESSRLWREVVGKMAYEYPEVSLNYLYVDNAAMQLILNPRQFDVMLTSNIFGDILSDEASVLTGSIGMLPSASLGDLGRGLYEPAHGSAPEIAGQDIANPIATILSAALLLRHSLSLNDEAAAIEKAVENILAKGYRTADICQSGCKKIGTKMMGDAVTEEIIKE